MHDNLALVVIVRSGVVVESNALVGGDGSQVPSDAGVHGVIVYGGRWPLLTFLLPLSLLNRGRATSLPNRRVC